MVTGPPGAGKTAVAEILVTTFSRGMLLRGDTFFDAVAAGYLPPWRPDANDQNETVIRSIGAAAQQFVAGGYLVVVDAVIGPWFLNVLLEHVPRPIGYVILRPTATVTSLRATRRVPPELVDPDVIRHMYDAFSNLGSHERFVIDSTEMSVDETVAVVAGRIAAGDNVLP